MLSDSHASERAASATAWPVSASPARPMNSTPIWAISLNVWLSAAGR